MNNILFIELNTNLINQMNQSNLSQSDELIVPKTNELNNLFNESKDLIHRYEILDSLPEGIGRIKNIYQSLTQRFEIMKNTNQSNLTEYIVLIDEFKILIGELIHRVDELEQKNINLEQRLRVLENKESERDTKIMINKYMIAIQDYNARYGIERILDPAAKDSLNKMRKNRNGKCHYCSKFCNDIEATQRFSVMIQRIETMDCKVKNVIEKRYPGLLNAIIETKTKKLKTYENISDQFEDEINEWWDEMV